MIAIPVVSCTGGQYWNGSACTCLSGLEFVGGVCTVVRTCPSGHVWNGYSCVPGSSAFSIGPGISGSWYDPSQSGHGFFLEVINEAPDTLDFSWFTFDDYGNQDSAFTASGEMNLVRLTSIRGLACP